MAATDPDTKATEMDWKTFTYGFAPEDNDDADNFSIDPDTGQLTTQGDLDYERKETMR